MTSPVCAKRGLRNVRSRYSGTSDSGEKRRRRSCGGGEWDDGRENEDRLHGCNADGDLGRVERKCLLPDDAGARVMAERAAQLVVKNRASPIMPRLKPGRRHDRVARVR